MSAAGAALPLTAPATTLTYAGARTALDATLAHADGLGVPVNVCICDRAGAVLAFARMDGAPLLSESIARDKAWSVAAFNGVATSRWFGILRDEPALREGIVHRDRLVIFGGGVPVVIAGTVVGAVGVSGGSVEQDEQIATVGAQAVIDGAG